MSKERDYKKEYLRDHASEASKKDRAARNNARREAERKGQVSKNDGRDVHHRDNNPRNNTPSNKAVIPRSKNRSIK
jgi:hypothetical protein